MLAIVSFSVSLLVSVPQQTGANSTQPPPQAADPAGRTASVVPPEYVIGPDDQLTILMWLGKDLSADVVVRPDGKISLPLLNEVQASGSTPDQLREQLTRAAKRYVEDPQATVIVRQINSRKVFITGEVEKPGSYSLTAPTTVLQLISIAGGLKEYAKKKKIVVMRTENGRQASFRFNYQDVSQGKNLKQNIELKPGDMVVVPQ